MMTMMNPFKFPLTFGIIFFFALANRLNGHPPKNEATSSSGSRMNDVQNLVIITDMEPDDRIALAMIASQLAQRVLAIGATVMNAARKAALVRHALIGTALENAKVLVGSGGTKDKYPEMYSTKPVREYGDKEGLGILENNTLEDLKKWTPSAEAKENEFQTFLIELLQKNNEKKIDFLILAPPTDLSAVLVKNSKLAKSIGQIHLMGGWNRQNDQIVYKMRNRFKNLAENTSDIPRSSYNVNMDGPATAQLLEMASNGQLQVHLYSSHILFEQFNGPSVNSKNFPKLIEMIMESKAPCLKAFRTAGGSWDSNLVETYESLKETVGPHVGKQFTPSDPITVLGFLKPELIKETKKIQMKLAIPSENASPEGYEVSVNDDKRSGITLITQFDMGVFEKEMERIISEIDQYEAKRTKKCDEEEEEEEDKKEKGDEKE